MERVQQPVIAYGWPRLLCEMAIAALSKHGWNLISKRGRDSQANDVRLALVYCSGSFPAVIEDIQHVRVDYPNARIVLLATDIVESEFVRLIETGVTAYVDVRQDFQYLLDTMRMLQENRSLASRRITQLVIEDISRLIQRREGDGPGLSLREKQVLHLITKGLCNKEIAESLRIAPNTVKNHVHNLLQKLNARNRHEAVWLENQHNR